MSFVPGPTTKLVAIAPGEDPAAWSRALATFTPSTTHVLKQDATTSVWSATLNNRPCVIKAVQYTSAIDRLKAAIHLSRGWRHWRGASWLISRSIPTAKPYMLARGTDAATGGSLEWLVMERLEGPTILEVLRDIRDDTTDLSVKQQHKIAAGLGVLASELVAQGRFNRDHKPSNLILTGWDQTHGDPTIAIIDCVAIRPCRRFDFKAMRRMLASLVIEPSGVGVLPRRSLLMRGLAEIQGQSWWREIERSVRLHGDPKPRINPFDSARSR
jgi:hypothetical protein